MADASAGFSVFDLRPMNLADLLDAIIRIYRAHFAQLLGICAVITVPLGVLQVISSSAMFSATLADPDSVPLPDLSFFSITGLGLYILLFWLTMPLMQAAVAKAVAQYYLGGRAALGESYRFALRKWWTLIWIMILIGLLTSGIAVAVMIPLGIGVAALGPGALSAPGEDIIMTLAVIGVVLMALLAALAAVVYISFKLYFGGLVAVLEDTSAIPALQRSWELTRGHLLRVFITIAILGLMIYIARGIVLWPAQLALVLMGEEMAATTYAIIQGLSALTQLVTQPLMVTGTVLLYYDLRIRKEGFDLTAMAEAIGEPQLAERPRALTETAALFGDRALSPELPEEPDEPEDQHPLP